MSAPHLLPSAQAGLHALTQRAWTQVKPGLHSGSQIALGMKISSLVLAERAEVDSSACGACGPGAWNVIMGWAGWAG